MDSFSFRRVVLPDATREQTDEMLARAMRWIGLNAPPDYVYTPLQLERWALANGFTREADTQRIAALLRRVAPSLNPPSPLATEVNDTLVALTRYIG
jgi:hypothetical protein